MPLGSRSRSRTKYPLYPLLSCQSSSVAPQMPHEFGEWFSVRSPVSASQRLFPWAPGCLPGLRGGADGGVHGLAAAEPLTSSFWAPSPLDGSPPKGLSDDGGFEEFVEFLASRSASSTAIACSRQRSSRRAPGSSPSKKVRFIAQRSTGGLFDMPAKESDSRLRRQRFSPETAQPSHYTAPPRIRDCERFRRGSSAGQGSLHGAMRALFDLGIGVGNADGADPIDLPPNGANLADIDAERVVVDPAQCHRGPRV